MLISLTNFYFTPEFAKPGLRAVASLVNEKAQANEVVIHTSEGSYLPFLIYVHDVSQALLHDDPDTVNQNAPSQFIVSAVAGKSQSIDEATEGYRRAWLVVALDHSIEHQKQQKRIFDERYELIEETVVEGIIVAKYNLP
jgi:hypothetical protein